MYVRVSKIIVRGGAGVAHQSHKLEVVGANPAPATILTQTVLKCDVRP